MKYKGSGLIEYALPLALIGIVTGIALYQIFSGGALLDIFVKSAKGNYNPTTKSMSINHKSDVSATVYSQNPIIETPKIFSSGTVASVAKSNCINGTCDIDFGSFTLKGVPENFEDFVKTHGNSGGTESLASLIEQVANQVETTDSATASEIRDLANLGHFISDIIEYSEKKAEECETKDGTLCFGMWQVDNVSQVEVTLPSNISHILPDFHKYNWSQNISLMSSITGPVPLEYFGKSSFVSKPYQDIDGYGGSEKAFAGQEFMYRLGLLKQKTTQLTEDQRGVIDKLAMNIQSLSYYHLNTVKTAGGDLKSVYSPETSVNTNVKSALICTTGEAFDNGKECNLP